jgi:hypothetical protein
MNRTKGSHGGLGGHGVAEYILQCLWTMKRKPPWRPGNASCRFLESSLADPKKSLAGIAQLRRADGRYSDHHGSTRLHVLIVNYGFTIKLAALARLRCRRSNERKVFAPHSRARATWSKSIVRCPSLRECLSLNSSASRKTSVQLTRV